MALEAVGFTTARLCANMHTTAALPARRRIGTSRCEVVGPANAATVARLQRFAHKVFGHIWAAPSLVFELSFAFAFSGWLPLGMGHVFGGRFGILVFALVLIVWVGLGCRLHFRSMCCQR